MKPLSASEALHKLAVYCSSAERCIQDIRKKLDRWEIPEESQQSIIKRLQQEKFLDELRFCRAFINDKSRFNKWGSNKIRYELKRKGIPENMINEVMANTDPEENRKRLTELLSVKKKTIKGKDEYDIRQKLIRFAAGRGFSFTEINYCMKKIFTDFDEIDDFNQ